MWYLLKNFVWGLYFKSQHADIWIQSHKGTEGPCQYFKVYFSNTSPHWYLALLESMKLPWHLRLLKKNKSHFAAKTYQNSQTYFILHDPVQKAGSGSHEDHMEEVKKWGWERQSFCPKVSVREVGSTVKFILRAQFQGCPSLLAAFASAT